MFTVRPGMYIRKVHVDFKPTELWKKHLSDKIVLWCERDSERRRGGCEGCDFLSVSSTRRHFSIHSNQDESGMFARGLCTCAHTQTHTHKVSRGRITSQQKSLLCLRFQSGKIVSKISHPITSVTILLVRESLCVCVWQKEKWRASTRETWRARERSALNHCVLWITVDISAPVTLVWLFYPQDTFRP